ncbi:methylmalonyl-CoA mutase family protein [Aridibaculum aurantiacum]|uniref:methylmalonyl-CoA mutase family protein n=1 Tax=Aridibaculum aurantiacum TaxID=2810307 RepID=UPI001F61F0B4|nr:methylmalonyl-CoA mutase family protein [Aridibaculum aurantiacum]
MSTQEQKVRIVTAASLFDGHDAAINIMRRILQSKGAEIIHLGHNRSVAEIVECAIEEDAHGIAITSYQGGHVEFFKYMKDLLEENGCGHIKIFGGGGGTILPSEIKELHDYGVTRIYSPDDGRAMGLEGMIQDVIDQCSPLLASPGGGGDWQQVDYFRAASAWNGKLPLNEKKDVRRIGRAITLAEMGQSFAEVIAPINGNNKNSEHTQATGQSSITVGQFMADPMLYGKLKEFALEHRKHATQAEELLWDKLRAKKEGYKFRRQHIIGAFIADFVCLSRGVVIEVDGNYHQLPEMQLSDAERTAELNKLGFDVLRFTNEEVIYQLDEVVERIHKHLADLPEKNVDVDTHGASHSSPAGGGREGAILGITGTGGAGKSSVTDEIVRRFLNTYTDKTIAVISVDPSKKKTGGALLGDRIRMNSIHNGRAYMRSLATRESDKALSKYVQEALDICRSAGFDLVILESAGVGQSDASILDYCDVSMYVMTPEYGAPSQLEKINMLDYADVVCINKFDKAGALDALHDVRKQFKRNHQLWTAKDEELPVVGTIAAQFNDAGINELFEKLMLAISTKTGKQFGVLEDHGHTADTSTKSQIIPPKRVRYLSEVAQTNREYDQWVNEQATIASKLYKINGAAEALQETGASSADLDNVRNHFEEKLHTECRKLIEAWPQVVAKYAADFFEYKVRDKIIKQPLTSVSLSGTRIPKVVLPKYKDWGDILRWQLQENVPGEFPYTAGVFELKRQGEDPTRMFAGEGGPERTNKRFHYVSLGQPAKRLSTAFDSVTLYGEDPAVRPDIYGKVGNSGVSIATVDDAKKLYSGFDLCSPTTSVSMTINGPAPMLLAFFMNAAIDQLCEKYIEENNLWDKVNEVFQQKYEHAPRPSYYNPSSPERLPEGNNGLGLKLLGLSGDEVLPADVYQKLKAEALSQVRGTVQADILKEDQAQNTCIFSTEFALKLMGDVQQYFIDKKVRNFYSVSISGYHIAEAGANPITQLAFTLANGFTYVEYYLSRGMNIDDFAPNLSFFFSNGMDPEYSVIGRVARRIWAKAMKYKYKGNDRSQKLKYHIQTSGRSLHAQEIDFNDIRTTLQALYAIYDNCNSLHTNAYDEAITTPTEESVRRAMAIQLIINRELGTAKNENPNQGSFLIEELTDLVEEAVLAEFDRLTERGGVLGAMERMYQRNKIQEESLFYEHQKHTGELPLIGVNTFLNKKGSPTILPSEVIRSTTEEKEQQIHNLQGFQKRNEAKSQEALKRLQQVAINNGNLFEELMDTVKYCSLGQITHALYQVGGQYRRNM